MCTDYVLQAVNYCVERTTPMTPRVTSHFEIGTDKF